ncbi:hypothetical protein DVH24_020347 [Malus domestica]|uniref:Glycolipid transfer protein domain-containing protein n=1 Tax=Malus domestica TaxID=3750 RepID=A0A498JB38_MALDO|nr:hypothetical protein DVH24_020347 [Malus domestica]
MARVVKRKDERILTRLADEFEQLAAQLNSRSPFTQACRLILPLHQQLQTIFKAQFPGTKILLFAAFPATNSSKASLKPNFSDFFCCLSRPLLLSVLRCLCF